MSLLCEACGVSPAFEESIPMPGIAVAVWMCRRCLRANSWPYPIIVAQQAILGIGEGNRAWQEMVTDTLADQGIDRALFDEDVGKTWLLLNQE